MKWIGQHIWDLISRFRGKVYIENLEGSNSTTALVIDPDGQLKTNSLGSGGNGEAAKVRLPVRFDEANGVSKGDPVYIKSYHGSVGPVIVAKADASSSAHMPAFGLADADYAHNADGYAISIGNLLDLDTSSYSVGDTLYVAVGGGLTNVKPTTEANLIQNVGTVARYNANNGQVEVVATGRSNDVPNLNSGNVFVGDVSNQATQQSLSSAITDIGDVTLSGDLAIGNDSDITCVGNMSFIVDSDDNESLQNFTWKHGGGSVVANIDESGTFNLYGVDLGDPKIRLEQQNQTASYGPPIFEFVRNAVTVDNADIGRADFIARNTSGSSKTYARMIGGIEEGSSGNEGGKLRFQVASHDGELQPGLVIEDGSQEDEVDVTIGNGVGSGVSIPGSISIDGPINSNSYAYFAATSTFGGGINIGSSDTTMTRTGAGEVSIEGKKIVTEDKIKQVFVNNFYSNLQTTEWFIPFITDLESTLSYNSRNTLLCPANGRVVCVTVRPASSIYNSVNRTVRVYVKNPGYMQPTNQEESEVVAISSSDDFESFQFFFDDDEHFQAGDSVSISFQDSNTIAGGVTYLVTTTIEFDYTQTGITSSGEIP